MPIPMPKRLFDSLIGHNVDILRVEAQFNKEIRALLEKLKRDLLREIADSGLDAQRTDWQKARLRDLLNAANHRINDTYDAITARMNKNLQGLAGTSTKILVDALNKSIDVDLFAPIKWTNETLHRIVSDTLIHGAKSSEWWGRQKASFTQKFSDEMRMGMLRGETLDQLRNRIVPKVDLRKEPDRAQRDLIKTARRNAEALVRTSTLTVMREAHLDVFEANADIIASVQWVSTLDNRTTPMCRHLDGKEWTIPGYEPKGHSTPFPGTSAHWNCRSVVIPITKTWEQLAKEAGGDAEFAKKLDAIPKGERASMGGPVDAGTTYETWFSEQDRERQLEILGPGRMEMYERGVLRVSDMARMDGSPMTLAELEAKMEDVKYETATGPFPAFYDPMKAIYDELVAKHGGDLKKVRADMPKVNYVIGNLPPHIKEVLRAKTEVLLFSADGLAKQLNHHPDLTTKEYASVFDKLKDCKEIYEGKDARIALIVKDGRHYAVLMKTTRSKTENYLVSLHRLDKDSLGVFRKLKRIY